MAENKQKAQSGLVRYLLSQTHISWALTAIFIGFMLGMMIARWLDVTNGAIVYLTGGIVTAIIGLISRLRLLIPALLVAGTLLGIARAAPILSSYGVYGRYIDTVVELQSRVVDDPGKIKTGWSLSLEGAEAVKEKTKLPGRIWISIKDRMANEIKRGDEIIIRGNLADGFGNYNASIRSAKLVKIIRRPYSDPMGMVRDKFAMALGRVMNGDELALGMGILAGQKSGLDMDVKNAFMVASLTHILVASGYNLTVLTRFVRRMLAKKSRIITLLLSITFVLLFAGITGNSASMSRAVLVAIFSLVTWYYGRNTHPVVLLSFISFLTVLISPSSLWGDAGWYMSFGSFAGVIILAPLISDLFHRPKNTADPIDEMVKRRKQKEEAARSGVLNWLGIKAGEIIASFGQIIIETISAQLMTLPIIAYFMGSISIVGLITNLPVLPLLPLTMLLTFIAGVAALLLPINIATVIALPARWLLDFINGVATWAANISGATIEFTPSIAIVIAFYLVVIALIFCLKLVTRHNFYGDNVIE